MIEDLEFAPATKEATKARVCLTGPSGSGKTYTGLMLAFGLGEKVAVIDSEHRTASKYVGRNGWQFDTICPTRFEPLSLVRYLGQASGHGYDVVMIDSLSHYWMGTDGMLELVDQRTKNGNKFTSGWKEMGPEEKKMFEAILAYPGHIITTLRVKVEYVLTTNNSGKQQPTRVGLKPEQRSGFEYEFDLVGDMDLEHNLTVGKSRIEDIDAGDVWKKPGIELAQAIDKFLSVGEKGPTPAELRDRALAATTPDELKALGAEAKRWQLEGAPMLDEFGHPTVLVDYLREMWTRMRSAGGGRQPAADRPAEDAA